MDLEKYHNFVAVSDDSPSLFKIQRHTIGIVEEVGKLCADLYTDPLPKKNMTKQLGSIIYRCAALSNVLGVTLEEVIEADKKRRKK